MFTDGFPTDTENGDTPLKEDNTLTDELDEDEEEMMKRSKELFELQSAIISGQCL